MKREKTKKVGQKELATTQNDMGTEWKCRKWEARKDGAIIELFYSSRMEAPEEKDEEEREAGLSIINYR